MKGLCNDEFLILNVEFKTQNSKFKIRGWVS